MAGSDYNVLVYAEPNVSDRRHLSEIRFGCPQPQQRQRNSTPGATGMALYVTEGFRSFWQSKLQCSLHESCVVRICSRIKIFYVYTFYRNPVHDGSLYGCLIDYG